MRIYNLRCELTARSQKQSSPFDRHKISREKHNYRAPLTIFTLLEYAII